MRTNNFLQFLKRQHLFVFLVVVLFWGCQDSNLNEIPIEEVQFELDEGKFITVKLDPYFTQESRSFSSLEEHDILLDELWEAGESITLNKTLYEDLNHYFDPYQISILDNQYQVEIEGILYKADREATYQMALDGNWTKLVHYGLGGDVDVNETSLVYQNLGQLHLLDEYDFQSPEARQILERLKSGSSTEGRAEAVHTRVFPLTSSNLQSGNDTPCECDEFFAYVFNYQWNGRTIDAQSRVVVWNEENAQWGTNAKSGTTVNIRDVSSNGRYGFNWVTPAEGNRIGPSPGYKPYVYVKHVTSNNGGSRTKNHEEAFGYKWTVSASGGRRSGWKTLSNHYVDFRDPSFFVSYGPLYRVLTVARFD